MGEEPGNQIHRNERYSQVTPAGEQLPPAWDRCTAKCCGILSVSSGPFSHLSALILSGKVFSSSGSGNVLGCLPGPT